MKSPVTWLGGKGLIIDALAKLIPEHTTYVEPFGGTAALLFVKPPSPVEVYNDIDEGLVNFYSVLRQPDLYAELERLLELTPHSRLEYYRCFDTWETCQCPVEKARRWFVAVRTGFSGLLTSRSWGYGVTAPFNNRFLSAIDRLGEAHKRLRRVQVEHGGWESVFDRYERDSTFFYLDPPYVRSTRKSGEYKHELDDDEHRRLVNRIQTTDARCLVSGYSHPIYNALSDYGWQVDSIRSFCSVDGRTRQRKTAAQEARTEVLWRNYDVGQLELF